MELLFFFKEILQMTKGHMQENQLIDHWLKQYSQESMFWSILTRETKLTVFHVRHYDKNEHPLKPKYSNDLKLNDKLNNWIDIRITFFFF